MCGIAGCYSARSLSHDEKTNAKTLLWLASLRGRDSTGAMVAWRKKGRTTVTEHKEVMAADSFIQGKEFKDMLNLPGAYMIGGHCRLATVGAVVKSNAHPISEGDLVGVHNGAVPSMEAAAREAKITDSRLLYRSIDQYGLKEALERAGDDVAFALQYIDLQERTLNFVRNVKRPLAFMFNREDTVLYWHSEAEALQYMATREGSYNFSAPVILTPGIHYTVELGSMEINEEELTPKRKTYPAPAVTTSVPQIPVFKKAAESALVLLPEKTQLSADTQGSDVERWVEFAKKRREASQQSTAVKKDVATSMVYLGFEGKVMPIATVISCLKEGCEHCTQPVTLDTEKPVYWIGKRSFICNDCRDLDFIRSYVSSNKVYRGELCPRN